MQQLDENIFRFEVPLPGSPLGTVNSYLLLGHERSLMVDTGFNEEDCRAVLEEGLEELNVNRDRLDFFLTHLHADHAGLAPRLAGKDSKIYLNEYGVNVLTSKGLSRQEEFARKNGFPDGQLEDLFSHHPGKQHSGDRTTDFVSLENDHQLRIDSHALRVVNAPGHTIGHQCLYEEERKFLFSGDHVLGDITPNISVHDRETRYLLVKYLENLDRVAKLDAKRVFPGHRSPFDDLKGRVNQLQEHHANRKTEVLEILEDGPFNGYQVAGRMSWDVPLKSWDDFPVVQRWFATGEAVAHLWALEEEDKVDVLEGEDEIQFTKSV